jgi:hypothetical protein
MPIVEKLSGSAALNRARGWLSAGVVGERGPVAAEGQGAQHGRRANARERAHPLHHLAMELPLLRPLRVLVRRQPVLHGQEVAGLEARVHSRERVQAAQQQAGPDEQDHGQRDLRHHQRATHARAQGAAGVAAAAFLQRLHEVGPREAKRGHETEQERGERGERDRVPDDRRIQAGHQAARQAVGRRRHQEAQPPLAGQQSERATGRPEQGGLGQELPHQPAAAGAQRDARRQLPLARGRAGQHQVRDVGAGDQQHQRHRGQQHQ